MSEFEHLYDMVALYSLQVEAVVTLIRSLAREHVDGQVAWGYLIVAHDNGMLDGICVPYTAVDTVVPMLLSQ